MRKWILPSISVWIPLWGLFGWSISPTIMTIDPTKPQVFFTLISEKGEKPVPVEVSVCERLIDSEGKDTEGAPVKEFLIYPSHVILKPGDTRTIRVVWKGDKKLDQEKAYRLVASSLPLPVEAPDKKEGEEGLDVNIALGTRYVNSLYVTPKGAKSKIECRAAYLHPNEPGWVVVELQNVGNAHQFLEELSLQLQGEGGEPWLLTKEVFKSQYGKGVNILANQTRKIQFPVQQLSESAAATPANGASATR